MSSIPTYYDSAEGVEISQVRARMEVNRHVGREQLPESWRQFLAEVGDRPLAKAERAILNVLAQHGTRTVTQVALLTGYSHKSGGYRNALSSLRSAGYIEGRGDVTATAEGLAALGPVDVLPTGEALRDWWKDRHLGKAERAILDVLADAWPAAVPVDVIAEATGYSATSGGFRNSLSRLRSLELAAGRGELAISDTLMED